ncbi:hypothetical protein G9464_08575 [Halostella sp. JP-L12]|uniref:HalOD1 output domain-containing protein n=1 Tax=Halostella TaxID=1843185 RepID=UPI000EF80EB9|nr:MULTISPECIES: HalOD1 output domain-containing protein [Halostella]NHN47650.1 hypothetical protein [Halostella sp. JP-L12]
MQRYELGPEEEPVDGVSMVIAALENRRPDELDLIADRISPDALNGLFAASETASIRLQFPYHEYEVVVTGDAVQVFEPWDEPEH